jgi:hypothetical protein
MTMFDPETRQVPLAIAKPTIAVPFETMQLRLMAKPFVGQTLGQMWNGPGWIDANGMACVLVIAPNDLWAKKVRQAGECAFIAWRWNGVPSVPFSLTLACRAELPKPYMRWMRASDDPVVQAIRRDGKFLVNVISTAGQHCGWHEAVFHDTSKDGPILSNEGLAGLWTFPIPGIRNSNIHEEFDPQRREPYSTDGFDEIPLWPEPISDYWATLGQKGPWEEDLAPKDRALATWGTQALKARTRAAGLIQVIIDGQIRHHKPPTFNEDGLLATATPQGADLNDLVAHFPVFGTFLAAVAGPEPEPKAAHDAVVEVFHDPKACIFFCSDLLKLINSVCSDEVNFAIGSTIESALLDHRMTKTGSARPWFANRGPGYFDLKFIDLDLAVPVEDVKALWRDGLEMMDLIDTGRRIGGKDYPVPHDVIYDSLKDVTLEGSVEDAEIKVHALLDEAKEARQWSIPWGARVELQFGPFIGMRIFEIEGEFSCHFLDERDRYFHIALGIRNDPPTVATHNIYKAVDGNDDIRENTSAEVALKLIAAAIVRDFLVVEDRTSVFTTRRHQAGSRQARSYSVIYLPRVRYDRICPTGMPLDAGMVARAKHSVSAHLRKANNASTAQRFLAQKYGVTLPTGFTFVRPHERGGTTHREVVKVYRSRSASRMIFKELDNVPTGTRPEWFEFERDCASILARIGMEVIHQAAHRDGDGGVDLFAVDSEGQSWVVQCKCWSPSRPVGPDVVRELAGAIQLADQGSDRPSKGKIITTSTFTAGASSAAREFGFDLVDGVDFVRLLSLTQGNG